MLATFSFSAVHADILPATPLHSCPSYYMRVTLSYPPPRSINKNLVEQGVSSHSHGPYQVHHRVGIGLEKDDMHLVLLAASFLRSA